jgi:hypothetical protein
MNITGKLNELVEYILQFVHKIKGYVEDIIAFFEDLRDRRQNTKYRRLCR